LTTVLLSKGDFSLLEKMGIAELLRDFNPLPKGGQIVLEGTTKQFELLLDVISDELSANGFSSTFEPTEYGRALEVIIDIINDID
jgi:hypothetical protein